MVTNYSDNYYKYLQNNYWKEISLTFDIIKNILKMNISNRNNHYLNTKLQIISNFKQFIENKNDLNSKTLF